MGKNKLNKQQRKAEHMITLRNFMEVTDYRVTEGNQYMWNCYGPDAYALSYWNQDQDGHTIEIVFDRKTQLVYEFEAHDYRNDRSYRWIHPLWVDAHAKESKDRGIDDNYAYDDVKLIEIEVAEDILEKAQAIINGEDYDTRVQIPLNLHDDVLFDMMKLAHERDITLNELVEQVLEQAIDLEKGKDELTYDDE